MTSATPSATPRPPQWSKGIFRNKGKMIEYRDNLFVSADGSLAGHWRDHIADFGADANDNAIDWYASVGGTNFQERMEIPFTMSSLDTPVYRACLEELRPADPDALIVDVGGGDGRNTLPWLEMGYQRIICVDPIRQSLIRLRDRLDRNHPGWQERVLLMVADARHLPLRDGCADLVLAIETLCYLNRDFRQGVAECARTLTQGGRFLWIDRAWEGALFVRLLYEGLPAMLDMLDRSVMKDGPPDQLVESRVFTLEEMTRTLEEAGLDARPIGGASILPVLMGAMRSATQGQSFDVSLQEPTRQLMLRLWKEGHAKRTLAVYGSKALA